MGARAMTFLRWWWDTCTCGCARESHGHYRRGRECAFCGPVACPRFRRRCLPDLIVWRR